MNINLKDTTQANLAALLEQLHTRYDFDELTPEDLVDALVELGSDLLISEEGSMQISRARLIDYCSQRVDSYSI